MPLPVTGIDEGFEQRSWKHLETPLLGLSLECDNDLAYLPIALKIPICVSGLFEWEGTVDMGFERTIREVLIYIPLHRIESFRRLHLVHHLPGQGNFRLRDLFRPK
jgi:hypothetical protein